MPVINIVDCKFARKATPLDKNSSVNISFSINSIFENTTFSNIRAGINANNAPIKHWRHATIIG